MIRTKYERNNYVIAIDNLDEDYHPTLMVGTQNPNVLTKVATFNSAFKAHAFCAFLDRFFGIEDPESRTQEVIADNPTYPAWEEIHD